MDENQVLITILGMAFVTFLPRALPLYALAGKKMPDWMISWLGYVPPAVLAAMLLPSILLQDGKITCGFDNLFLWVALPTFVAAVLTKNLFIPVIIGMLILTLTRLFL